MIEMTVTTKGHQNGWLLCELRNGRNLVAKVCAPACLLRLIAESLDKDFVCKSLIPLLDSDAAMLLFIQEMGK